jgi:hypothetical protein
VRRPRFGRLSKKHRPAGGVDRATRGRRTPRKIFLSYSWDDPTHMEWVEKFAFRLKGNGLEVVVDQWNLKLGDSITRFMETAVESCDFVLLICTPQYRLRAEKRTGGVGYEHDLMTAQKLTSGENAKFIPVLRAGTWYTATPKWLAGHLGVDLRGKSYAEDNFQNLVDHLLKSPIRRK